MVIKSIDQISKAEVKMEGAEKAFKQIPVSAADGTPSFSMRVFTIKAGGHTPYHSHDYEHINYIISGTGEIIDENGSPKELKTGDFALVLPNEKHQYRNNSLIDDFVMICGVPKNFE